MWRGGILVAVFVATAGEAVCAFVAIVRGSRGVDDPLILAVCVFFLFIMAAMAVSRPEAIMKFVRGDGGKKS